MAKHTQFIGKLPTNCLSALDHFVKLALKDLNSNHRHALHEQRYSLQNTGSLGAKIMRCCCFIQSLIVMGLFCEIRDFTTLSLGKCL